MWQYITLMKRIYLIDCPGVVPPSNTDSEEDILLRGVVRVEHVENPEQYIAGVLKKTKPQHIERTYDVKGYKDATEFLELLARKGGRLLKGGEADLDGVAKMVLNDFLRGKIPWFTPPPEVEGEQSEGVAGRDGRLGEMGRKRKREDDESAVDPVEKSMQDVASSIHEAEDGQELAVDDFEGFNDADDVEEDGVDASSEGEHASGENVEIDASVSDSGSDAEADEDSDDDTLVSETEIVVTAVSKEPIDETTELKSRPKKKPRWKKP